MIVFDLNLTQFTWMMYLCIRMQLFSQNYDLINHFSLNL